MYVSSVEPCGEKKALSLLEIFEYEVDGLHHHALLSARHSERRTGKARLFREGCGLRLVACGDAF